MQDPDDAELRSSVCEPRNWTGAIGEGTGEAERNREAGPSAPAGPLQGSRFFVRFERTDEEKKAKKGAAKTKAKGGTAATTTALAEDNSKLKKGTKASAKGDQKANKDSEEDRKPKKPKR